MLEYLARLTKEGDCTLIDFPDCPGCSTFAEPHENVEDVAREALEGYLEAHLVDGQAPPAPKAAASRRARSLPISVAPALAIALQVRWRRQELGLSQAQLGKRLGVTRQQVALLEQPTGNLRILTLERVAAALGTRLAVEFATT